jgi:hypothetical protein
MILLLQAGVARACALISPPELTVVPDPSDLEAPGPPAVGAVTVTRGKGPVGCGATIVHGSCDDVGWVYVPVARLAADPDAEADVGYAVVLVSGTPPQLLYGLPSVEHPIVGPTLWFPWMDEATDDQEPLDFVLGLVPVDRAGNAGAMVEVVVSHPGSVAVPCEEEPADEEDDAEQSAACHAVPGSSAGAWLFPLLWVGARLRRRTSES